MKRIIFAVLAVCGLLGSLHAEGTGTKFSGGDYNVYRSSDVALSTTGARVAYSSILHKVIISSPAYEADVATNAVVGFYNASTSASALRFEVPYSTFNVTGSQEWTFDIAMSSGIWPAAANSSYLAGKVTAIYADAHAASAQGWKVWSSTYMPADTAVHRIEAGPVLLHKIIVLTKGTGTSVLTAYDSYVSASPSASRRVAAVDLTDTAREYTYNVMCSSGITVQASGAGTVNPKFIILYKRNPSQDYEVWKSSFTTGTATAVTLFAGQGVVFGGVVNGDSVAASSLTVYDTQGATSKILTKIDGSASFDRKMFDVQVSSGITYSSSGNGLYSILYKRR